MKTFMPTPADMNNDWIVVDAADQVLGRLATQIALRLRGKHKPEYTPHADLGDFVVVVNVDKIRVTGKKLTDKLYRRHSGFMGGLKETILKDMLAKKPDQVLKLAVKGMLPKTTLGRQVLKKLKIYSGPSHPHEAQQPRPVALVQG